MQRSCSWVRDNAALYPTRRSPRFEVSAVGDRHQNALDLGSVSLVVGLGSVSLVVGRAPVAT